MRTTNPALSEKAFYGERSFGQGESMTLQGTVNKTFVLLGLAAITGALVWGKIFQAVTPEGIRTTVLASAGMYLLVGGIGGFVAALVTIFNKKAASISAPIYAACEGMVLGAVSAIFEMRYPGIVVQAVSLTFGTLFCLLGAYKSGLIKVTENFKLGIVAATGAICLVYFLSWVLSFFHITMPVIYSSSLFGIGFSLFVVVIAALNLVLDFDFIEQGVSLGVPKYMEWYGAFGLMVTLVWLYMEILRLLAKLRDRR